MIDECNCHKDSNGTRTCPVHNSKAVSPHPKNAPVEMPHSGHLPHGIQFRVPWRIHQKAWETYAKHYNNGQSAEKLATRGGFGLMELIYLLAGEDPFTVREDDTMATDFFGEWPEDKTQ